MTMPGPGRPGAHSLPRRATAADLGRVEAILRAHIDGSMFPLANLRAFGLDGEGPRAMRVWLAGGGAIGLTNEGMLMPQMPGAKRRDWVAIAEALRGEAVTGAVGPAVQVRAILAALGLAGAPSRIDEDEPGYALDLCDLIVPVGTEEVLEPLESHRALAVAWRADYEGSLLGHPPADAERRADDGVDRFIGADSHRILVVRGTPVAMTGFNARLPEIVQVGGVYTPPHLRRRGHARRAVALHLAQARGKGTGRAVLFAASEAAARAYVAIGFARADDVALVLLDTRPAKAP